MIAIAKYPFLTVTLIIFNLSFINSQEKNNQKNNKDLYRQLDFYDLRGSNAIDLAVGTSFVFGDYPDSKNDFLLRIGFKHHITSNIGVNLSYNKYNLNLSETFNEGYMSFDFNLEYLVIPYHNFSPFVYGGFGYNTSNDFENSQTKVQAGLGVEYIVFDGLGVKLYGEYNQVFSDELEGLVVPGEDESILRVGLGVNIYFGGEKRKESILNSIDTVINSNLIE
ncbi:outer membrane beta-barrel protein [Winogradskyella sp.]|jgi:curli production assembly/transport component CsgG|uniref:outer membrane beta-barrel protein n=1 Tax=Winogradskyella sp. TaxID=1883156 RepID=UPI0025D5932F|nr:outer membrane beta-barrel protein [Winogradskyella sp.]MCT4630422.1 porin family protein [Winogradskyella sp.]